MNKRIIVVYFEIVNLSFLSIITKYCKKLEDAEKQFKEEYINKCKEFEYKEISSDTAKHRGEYAMFSGEVFEMFEGDGYYFLVINVTLKDNDSILEYGETTILSFKPLLRPSQGTPKALY